MAALALSGVGCGMHLRSELPGSTIGLAGQWRLTTQREVLADQLHTAIEQAQAKEMKRYRSRRPEGAANGEPVSNDDILPPEPSREPGMTPPKRDNWVMRDLRERTDGLINAVLPSRVLRIVQAPRRVEMFGDAGPARRFDAGVGSTLVTGFATLRIESGWQGSEFVVHSRDAEQGLDIVERYRRLDGTHLQMQVRLKQRDVPTQQFVADYRLDKP